MNRETIEKLVKASGVSTGELVLVHFWGEDEEKEIANRFIAAVAAQGATPVLLQQARTVNREIFASARDGCFDERYFQRLSGFDTVLDLFAYRPVVLGFPLPEEPMARYRKYISQLFYRLMECKRFVQIRIPTPANAEESGLEPTEYIARMERAYEIDYDELTAACRRKVSEFAEAEQIALHTGEDCVLRFDLTGRTWQIDAGDGDLPCGEIYIAPLETQTNGSVFFKTFRLEDAVYTDVVVQVADGEVTGSSCGEVAEWFATQPRENRIVCELGFGMNPNVTDLCGYTLLDEKMAGTFHIAVGANQMFGGSNKASVHIDFVGCGNAEVIE